MNISNPGDHKARRVIGKQIKQVFPLFLFISLELFKFYICNTRSILGKNAVTRGHLLKQYLNIH